MRGRRRVSRASVQPLPPLPPCESGCGGKVSSWRVGLNNLCSPCAEMLAVAQEEAWLAARRPCPGCGCYYLPEELGPDCARCREPRCVLCAAKHEDGGACFHRGTASSTWCRPGALLQSSEERSRGTCDACHRLAVLGEAWSAAANGAQVRGGASVEVHLSLAAAKALAKLAAEGKRAGTGDGPALVLTLADGEARVTIPGVPAFSLALSPWAARQEPMRARRRSARREVAA